MPARRLPLLGAALLGAVACGGGSSDRIGLVTSDIPEWTGPAAGMTAPLLVDRETGCILLGTTLVIWPQGFTARADPIRIYRPTGELVAIEGDVVQVAGGEAVETASVHLAELEGCTGDPWLISAVERVDR